MKNVSQSKPLTKIERITRNVEANKEIQSNIGEYYSTERFIKDGFRYIKAIKEGRMINSIASVAPSGMSRNIKFLECAKMEKGRYQYLNFFAFFKALGYTESRKDHYFKINGCGMDMIFHTNYTNIHTLEQLGFISRKQCNSLAQDTPQTI